MRSFYALQVLLVVYLFYFFVVVVAVATLELERVMFACVCQTLCLYLSQRCFVVGWRLFLSFHFISFYLFIYFTLHLCQNVSRD